MVVTIAMFVRGDMSVFQSHLAVADNGIGRAQIHLSFTIRFDFGADQRDTCLHRSLYRVIVVSLSIDGNYLEWLPIRCSFLLDCCLFCHKKLLIGTYICSICDRFGGIACWYRAGTP